MGMMLAHRWQAVLVGLMLVLPGCAGSPGSPSSRSNDREACLKAVDRMVDPKGCDRFVASTLASKNAEEIFDAYYYRSIIKEFMGDLPGALADADQAIAAKPSFTFAYLRRAALLGESGRYEEARQQFAHHRISDPTPAFDETSAMVEYVIGDRRQAAALFESAARDYAENDHDENMAAILRFNAAIIESELSKGDPAPIAAQDVSGRTDTMLPILKRHRLGQLSDGELMALVARMTGAVGEQNRCDAYFSIGHRNVLAGDTAAARKGFQDAAATCSAVTFEHHAAQAWLRQLGG